MKASSSCAQGFRFDFGRLIRLSGWCSIALFRVALGTANAGPVLTFNPLASGINSYTGADPIETYIEGVIGSNVTVYTGARTLKNEPEAGLSTQWIGNTNYVNGVLTPHADPKDTYLINRWSSGYDRIKICFDVAISSIEFD